MRNGNGSSGTGNWRSDDKYGDNNYKYGWILCLFMLPEMDKQSLGEGEK